MIPSIMLDKYWRVTVQGMFVFYCIVNNSLYCRVCLYILWGSSFRVFCSFLIHNNF